MSKWSVQLSIDGQTYTFTNTGQQPEQPKKPKTELSPYLYTWGYNNTVYQINKCMDLYNKLEGKSATIAFVVGKTCDDVINTFKQDFSEFVAKGGQVTVAFGGANGPYMEEVLTSHEMVLQIDTLIYKTGIKSLDFDIEGSHLTDSSANLKRSRVIRQLQERYPDLKVRFTLPVDRNGLTQDAINLLTTTQDQGVKIAVVNIMTMDIGTVENWGETARLIAIRTVDQIKPLFRDEPNIFRKLGITAMIGKNDDNSVFRSADMTFLARFCKEQDVALLSFWSINRDQVGTGDLSVYSQHNTKNFEYFEAAAAIIGK